MQDCKHEIKNRLDFMLAGKSIFTLKSEKTNKHFTFKIQQLKNDNNEPQNLWFVSAFNGIDNCSHYKYFGTINKSGSTFIYRFAKKAKLEKESLSVKSFEWFFKNLNTDKLTFYHENHCARCGRKLTHPDSIESGFGPECINLIHKY